MNKNIVFFILLSYFSYAQNNITKLETDEYQLIKIENSKILLVLFPCFPCDANNTFNEFKIEEECLKNEISVLALNFNKHLFLNLNEKEDLVIMLNKIVKENLLNIENVFIGGFSSGGNVSLILSDYLIKNKNNMQPKGVFIVDSPVDLNALYKTAEYNIQINYSKPAIEESLWIIDYFNNEFGNPKENLEKYEEYSPYIQVSENINNLKNLSKIKIRLYTEPDLEWWQKRAKNNYENLNAFYIEKLYQKLKLEFGEKNKELIQTINKGYRSNGEKHPHSWSIVDIKNLINWMKN